MNDPVIDRSESQLAEVQAAPLAVPTTPEGILSQAIASKMDPASMKELYALFQQMKKDQAAAAFNGAMSLFREKCGLVAKSKTAKIVSKSGASFSFDYAPIEEVAATINEVIAPLGLSYEFDEKADDKGVTITCTRLHRDGHERSTTAWCPYDFDAKMTPANMTTGAWTTARRKALMGAFGLVAADEKDLEYARGGGGGGESITAHQADTLDTMLSEFSPDRRAKFLVKIGYPTLAAIPASRYQEAVNMIESARKAGAK